jgi:hypothetical protein
VGILSVQLHPAVTCRFTHRCLQLFGPVFFQSRRVDNMLRASHVPMQRYTLRKHGEQAIHTASSFLFPFPYSNYPPPKCCRKKDSDEGRSFTQHFPSRILFVSVRICTCIPRLEKVELRIAVECAQLNSLSWLSFPVFVVLDRLAQKFEQFGLKHQMGIGRVDLGERGLSHFVNALSLNVQRKS